MFSRPSNSIKGLSIFISDLRDCATPEDEARRVNSEFSKILSKFGLPTLSGYDYKKYVYKLVYAYILGYDAEVGRMQALNLLASAKLSEKTAGYLGLAILANSDSEILRLSLASVKTDLTSPNELIVGLALNFLANAGNSDFTKSMLPEILRILDAASPTSLYIRRKALFGLLRLARSGYVLEAEQWAENLASFLSEGDVGVVNAAASLALYVLKTGTDAGHFERWGGLLKAAFKGLNGVNVGGGGRYYGVTHPWVQVKLLGVICRLPLVLYDSETVVEANEQISMLFAAYTPEERMQPTKTVRAELDRLNKLTAEHCILFAATDLALGLDRSLISDNRKTVGQFLATAVHDRGPNVKYLALERLGKLAATTNDLADSAISAFERKLFERCRTIVVSEIVTGVDAASRRAALAVLVATCDRANWETAVEELLTVLGTLPREAVRCSLSRSTSERSDALALLKEELALQIALIAERFAPDSSWNVDILFRALKFAPACVSDAVIRRVLALIAPPESLSSGVVAGQSQAAERAYEALGGKQSKLPTVVPQNVLALSAFVLGEYGWRLVDSRRASALRLVEVIAAQLPAMTRPGVGLFALAKLGQRFAAAPGVREEALATIESFTDSLDLDAAQRANELIALFSKPAIFSRLFAAESAAGPADSESSDSESEAVDPKTLWRFLCVKPEGVLFASGDLEVDVRQSYEATGGRLQVRLSARRALTDVAVTLSPSEGVAVAADRQLSGASLTKGETVQQTLTVALKSPFLNPPKYILKYRGEGGRETSLPLSLPVVLTKFARPVVLTADAFAAKWAALGAAGEAAIEAEPAMEFTKLSGYLVHGFNLGLVAGGGGVLEAAASVGGVETLVRVTAGVRICVRATTATVARYLANILASYFVLAKRP